MALGPRWAAKEEGRGRDALDNGKGGGDGHHPGKIAGRDEVRQHLAELGFVVDTSVTVVSELAGNLILQVKDSRIALDKTMAMRVII